MTALDERPIAYSYVRMSSQQQAKGDSLRRQLDLSEEYARINNLKLDHSLRDIGVSAWTGANVKIGALGRFLELVQTGQIAKGSYLLVESLDRLSRERVIDALEPFLSILRSGIIVVTLADKQVYSADSVGTNFTQLMMSLAIMARAHEESQIKSHRITQAHARRRADAAKGIGKYTGHMFGWIDQVEVAPKTYEYRLNDHAKTVRKVFELADQGLGCLKIERELIRLNMMGVKGKPISNGNISVLLKNEAVIGTYQPTHRVDGVKVPFGEPLKNFLPAAVTPEMYWRVQKNRREPHKSGRKGPGFTNLFPSLLSCGHCGERLMMVTSGAVNKRYQYVQCRRKYLTKDCHYNHGMFRYDVLENAILDHVSEFQQVDAFVSDRETLAQDVARQEERLAGLVKRRANVMAALEYADTEVERRDLAAQLRFRRTDIEEAQAELDKLKGELETVDARRRDQSEFSDRIKIERMTWTTAAAPDLYRSRSRVSVLIRKTITHISVNFETKQLTVAVGSERAYLFDSEGRLLQKHDARTAGLHNKGTSLFSKTTENGKTIYIAHRPRYDGTEDIPIETIGGGAEKQLAPHVVEAREERKRLIKRIR